MTETTKSKSMMIPFIFAAISVGLLIWLGIHLVNLLNMGVISLSDRPDDISIMVFVVAILFGGAAVAWVVE